MKKCAFLSGLFCFTAACGDDGRPVRDDAGVSAGLSETGGAEGSTSGPAQDDGSDEETDGATGTTDGGDASSTGAEAGGTCEQAQFSFDLEPQTPNVMLVLDKSRSMSNLWDHDLDPSTPQISRWHSLFNVVDYLTAELQEEINFGAQLFPSADAWLDEPTNVYSCAVSEQPEVSVAALTREAILDAMPAPGDFSISGGTPASTGVTNAIEHLVALGSDLPRAIILITDGAANCNPAEAPEDTLFVYDDTLPDIVYEAFTMHQIPVYVVGINILDEMGTKPAVNPHQALTEVALAGGVPSQGIDAFYNSFNEMELADAVGQVVGAIECTVTLEVEPDFPDHVEVTVSGTTYPQVADCDAEDGWVYTSPNGPFNAIQLCGVACDDLQGEGGVISVDYVCPE